MPGRFRDTLVVLWVGCLVTPSLTQGHEPSHQDTITRKIEDPVFPPMAGRGVHSRQAYSLPDRGIQRRNSLNRRAPLVARL